MTFVIAVFGMHNILQPKNVFISGWQLVGGIGLSKKMLNDFVKP